MPKLATTLPFVYEVAAVAVNPPGQTELAVPALVAVALVVHKAPNRGHRPGNSPRLKMELLTTRLLTVIDLRGKTTFKLQMDGFHRITLIGATPLVSFYLDQIPTLAQSRILCRLRISTQQLPPGRTTT